MKKVRSSAAILLCLSLILGSFGFGFGAHADDGARYMQQTVKKLGGRLEGERMFDYLSYVYMGWRTTGGSWQNQVIDTFIVDELKKAGYRHSGEATSPEGYKSINDMSATDDDYSWVTYFDVEDLTWNPEYAKLEISTKGNFEGKNKLIDRINVEAYGFDPTGEAYLNHYKVENIDQMWSWIAEKDPQGNRINVLNGKEAELNKRVHLARNSCFTDSGGTKPEDAAGVKGEIVYVGSVSENGTASELADLTGEALKAELNGKVLLSDSSLSNTFNLAKSTGAVSVMSKNTLSEKAARYGQEASLSDTKARTESGAPIVEWKLSEKQYDALKELLYKSDKPIIAQSISIGDAYAMNDGNYGGKGQALAFAEIKGATKPEERIFICAHVQEAGANDSATGAAALLELATEMKVMIDGGVLERPERTITFMWGDEKSMAARYLNSHPEERKKIIACLEMDMVGADTKKTGEVIKIENMFNKGYYLSDVYMYAARQVNAQHDHDFKVELCSYEEGSDHSVFTEYDVPAVLTGQFTDYKSHTFSDTLERSSAEEMENVGISTLATALLIANATDENQAMAGEMLDEIFAAAMDRFEKEEQNTLNHENYAAVNESDYAAALAKEKEALAAWHDWYQEALFSIEERLLKNPLSEYEALRNEYSAAIKSKYEQSVNFAEEMLTPTRQHFQISYVEAKAPTEYADGNISYLYCEHCGKYYGDEDMSQEISLASTVVRFATEGGVKASEGKTDEDIGGQGARIGDPEMGDDNNPAMYLLVMLSVITTAGVLYKKKD